MNRPPKNTGVPYELALQRIFQEIHEREPGRTIKVEQNVQVQGRCASHQIDLLWTFTIAGIDHQTIVQARDWNQRIKQEAVSAFNDILKDIPGQPRGVIVTRTGFQQGAKQVADFHGIKLYILRHGPPGISMTDISYATYKLEGCRMPGGGQGVLVRATVYRPEARIELIVDPTGPRPKFPKDTLYRDIKLYNADKQSIGTIRDFLAGFVSTMEKKSQLTESFAKDFLCPTFIQSLRSKRFFGLQSLRANIDIVKEEMPPVFMKPPGFVDFVLEDLETGSKQSFIQPAIGKGR